MLQFPLKLVLLLAVAMSQVFGGISCCCLGRTLFGNRPAVEDSAIQRCEAGAKSVSKKKAVKNCPKCAGRSRSVVWSESVKRASDRPSVDGESTCRCARIEFKASSEIEPVSIQANEKTVGTLGLSSVNPMGSRVLDARRFEVPVRFGGRSWQTIACVWKN